MCLGFVYDVVHSSEWWVGIVGKHWHYQDHRNPVEIDLFVKFHGTRIGTTRQMLNVGDGNAIIHSEATAARFSPKLYRDDTRYSHHVMGPLNLFTVLQLKMSQPLKSKSRFVAWKSLDSESCIPLMKKGW